MRPPVLCRERLNRILLVLTRQGGSETIRQLERRFSIWRWEIEQAAALGWVEVETRKPRTGRPSKIAKLPGATVPGIVSKSHAAKLPPWRRQIKKEISHRHWSFAMHCAMKTVKRGFGAFGPFGATGCWTDAYQRVYRNSRSRAGARASVSRLMKHPDIRALRAWWYAVINQRIPHGEDVPNTAAAIWERLRKAKP